MSKIIVMAADLKRDCEIIGSMLCKVSNEELHKATSAKQLSLIKQSLTARYKEFDAGFTK